MCLIIKKSSVALIATEDIICYKVLTYIITVGKWLTYFKYSPVTIGDTYHSELTRQELTITDAIEKGLHSFASLEDANNFVSDRLNVGVFKCVIPKGSTYYKGSFFNWKSYASDTLVYIEIIK